MQRTKIEWATHTWNPSVGCSKVSAGCANCYAKAMVNRFPRMTGVWPEEQWEDYQSPNGWDGKAHFFPERLEEPFHLRPGKDRPHRIFVCSMSDLFHESLSNEQIAAVFGVMAATPQHQYVVLTKRVQRAVEWFRWADQNVYSGSDRCLSFAQSILGTDLIPLHLGLDGRCPPEKRQPIKWPLQNVIICASVENQQAADERIPLLLQIPARWRGISVEPMLEGINIGPWLLDEDGLDVDGGWPQNYDGLDLVICGAETGPGKRPFLDEWALDLRDQCKAAGTPFFFKKDGHGNGSLCGVEYHEWIGE